MSDLTWYFELETSEVSIRGVRWRQRRDTWLIGI